MTLPNSAHIAIIDDDPSVRHSLRMLLETRNLRISEFERAHDFLQQADPVEFQCLLIDVRIPEMNGLELFDELLRKSKLQNNYLPPVIFLSGHGDIPLVVRVLRQGAVDFLEKPADHRSLIDAINRALESDEKSRLHFFEQAQILNEIAELTQRERMVLTEIVAGYLGKQIADHLSISPKTVEAHRLHICQKLKVRTSMELAAKLRDIPPSLWQQT
ncbi:response regulator transcription factor [Undibacterium fentianense]|uniref:Response regulator transcription factor n=1 Tax=Undibacterium fentianense TaxID=2828728 RepID=A0A941ICJ7_9BURK|nr:response regulator [Undibacterium fentianense]MBR7800269.1 response regulator transcription factor [Undibacterium fentianense]